MQEGLSSTGLEALLRTFDFSCKGQPNCELKIQYSWFNKNCRDRIDYYATHSKYRNFTDIMQWDNQWLRDFRVREPVIFAVAFCLSDQVMTASGESMGF